MRLDLDSGAVSPRRCLPGHVSGGGRRDRAGAAILTWRFRIPAHLSFLRVKGGKRRVGRAEVAIRGGCGRGEPGWGTPRSETCPMIVCDKPIRAAPVRTWNSGWGGKLPSSPSWFGSSRPRSHVVRQPRTTVRRQRQYGRLVLAALGAILASRRRARGDCPGGLLRGRRRRCPGKQPA